MEDGLGVYVTDLIHDKEIVLILVLMEDGFGEYILHYTHFQPNRLLKSQFRLFFSEKK
jgi:hypothetical protein